ncbi:MAG: hypothetical protein IPN18_17580 [Ignavibacteriales bacterium]|nr:hypothetical protein [Ignavibacteriales bacterium]
MQKSEGDTQNDILKEYIAQKEYILSSTSIYEDNCGYDRIIYKQVPPMESVSVSGLPYPCRRVPLPFRRLAYTLADGFAYIKPAWKGEWISMSCSQNFLLFNSHLDFLKKIAKFRTDRKNLCQKE